MKHLIIFVCLILFISIGCNDANGPTGKENVKVITFEVQSSDWQKSSGVAVYIRNIPQIKQSIINSGLVLLYSESSQGTSTQWNFTVPYDSEDHFTYWFNYSVGELTMMIIDSYQALYPEFISKNQKFKAVIIEGTPAMIEDLKRRDLSDYETVKNQFNIME